MQGKIHPLPRNRVIGILQKNGFVHVKNKGPHQKFKKFDGDGKCMATTMVSNCPEIQPTIVKMIIKQSKIPEEEFY